MTNGDVVRGMNNHKLAEHLSALMLTAYEYGKAGVEVNNDIEALERLLNEEFLIKSKAEDNTQND